MEEDEINRIIDLLQLDEWTIIEKWDDDLAPNFYISINGETLIKLFEYDEYGIIDKGGYYEIPKNVIGGNKS